jgi:hypothetical protein
MAGKSVVGFHPDKSTVSDDTLNDFIRAPITGKLTEVPGIGEKGEEKLREAGITTTYELIGEFLKLKGEGVQSVEHCDRFWYFLQNAGLNSSRSGIVKSIAMKVDCMIPGMYDGTLYE